MLKTKITAFFHTNFGRTSSRLIWFDGIFAQFIALMVYVSIGLIIAESDRTWNFIYRQQFAQMNTLIYLVFTIDFFYKHFVGVTRLQRLFSLGTLIDILALLPFYLPMFTHVDYNYLYLIRLVWVVKIFRVPRYKRTVEILKHVFDKEKETLSLAFTLCFTLVLVSSILMWTVEGTAQPDKFTSITATMWWSVSTVTTVGYGDIFPITVLGKMLVAFTALAVLCIFVIPTAVINAGFFTVYQQQEQRKKETKNNYTRE